MVNAGTQMMKTGILEVLVVHAKGIKHTNLVGRPAFYVIIQCGTHIHQSKVSSVKDEKARWNEKFTFEFPPTDWRHLTHLKLKIMDTNLIKDGGFVGETIIYLGGIITEGTNSGMLEVKPAPYNVVLEDDTYKGLIKLGFKFITTREGHHPEDGAAPLEQVNEPKTKITRSITNLCELLCLKFLFNRKRRSSNKKSKKNYVGCRS